MYISGLLLNIFLDYNIEVTKSYLMNCFSNVQRSPYTANPVHYPQLWQRSWAQIRSVSLSLSLSLILTYQKPQSNMTTDKSKLFQAIS